jgi:hypothetical protein
MKGSFEAIHYLKELVECHNIIALFSRNSNFGTNIILFFNKKNLAHGLSGPKWAIVVARVRPSGTLGTSAFKMLRLCQLCMYFDILWVK